MPGSLHRIAAASRPSKRGIVPILLVALALSACAAPAPEQRVETPEIRGIAADTEVREYEVRGYNARAIRKDLERLGPKDWSGVRYQALTEWTLLWSVQYDRRDDACAVEYVTTTLEVVMDLPRWSNAASGSNTLKRRWQVFLDQLVWHENMHREYGVRAAAEIEKQLMSLPAAATCEALEREINAVGKAVVRKFHVQSTQYDVTTKHGALQGVRFP